jgi:hypothetical protein
MHIHLQTYVYIHTSKFTYICKYNKHELVVNENIYTYM